MDLKKTLIAIVGGTLVSIIISFILSLLAPILGGVTGGLLIGKGVKKGFVIGFVIGLLGGLFASAYAGFLFFDAVTAFDLFVVAILGGIGGLIGQNFSKTSK